MTRGERREGRNVLVVSTVESPGERALETWVGDADAVKLVVPVVRQGVLDWLANDERAFSHAAELAERTAENLDGTVVSTAAGESDVGLAILDALATFPADEVVVALDERDDELVARIRSDSELVRLVEGVPVRVVIASP